MNNDSLKKTIHKRYLSGFAIITENSANVTSANPKNEQNERDMLHEEIANTIEKITPNSIRKLEEQTFHLYKGKAYFKLKEVRVL
jgi:hypothetical protein